MTTKENRRAFGDAATPVSNADAVSPKTPEKIAPPPPQRKPPRFGPPDRLRLFLCLRFRRRQYWRFRTPTAAIAVIGRSRISDLQSDFQRKARRGRDSGRAGKENRKCLCAS